jgi:hypothetical protein
LKKKKYGKFGEGYNTNTPTPLFPMENKKGKKGVSGKKGNIIVDKKTEESVKKILNDSVPKETSKNRISVGKQGVVDGVLTYYCPHNCRVYFVFDKKGFVPPNRYDNIGCSYSLVNSSEHLFKDFHGVNVCVKKRFVEVRPLHPKWYVIEKDKSDLVELQKKRIQDDLLERCRSVLRAFVDEFGGKTDFKIHHFRILERKFENDKVTNKIPKNMMFRNKVVKKLYYENNLEYSDGISDVNDVAYHDNYTRNIGLFDYAPEIANELVSKNKLLNNFEKNMDKISGVLLSLTSETKNMAYNASSHIALVNEAKEAIIVLSDRVGELSALGDVGGVVSSELSFLKKNFKGWDDIDKYGDKICGLSEFDKELFSAWLIENSDSLKNG